MPFHIPTQDRRQFIQFVGTGVIACSSTVNASHASEKDVESDLVCLLNDTHVGEKQPTDSAVPRNLRQVVKTLVALEKNPACVIINGDLALYDGQPGDYRHFAKLIQPLHDAEIDVHLTLGNHDNREVFYEVMKDQRPEKPLIRSHHISVVETRFANFFLLDSLTRTMVTQGTIGKLQLDWLKKALDAYDSKPAIIVAHHNPRLGGDPNHFPGGLIDSSDLWEILSKRMHVKAYIHGHIHDRSNAEHAGIHILNTPATSYVANPKLSTTGWTTARLTPKDVTLTTHTTDEKHAWNSESNTLTWRS